MTNQIPDILIYEGEQFELLGDYTKELPFLHKYGIEPIHFSTACVSGYVAHYVIDCRILYLSSLIMSNASNSYLSIGGIDAELSDIFRMATYPNLYERMNLTGQIVIGEHLPYSMSLKRNIALRLNFDDGELKKIEDITYEYSRLVKKIDKIFNERNSLWMRLFSSESKRDNHRKYELHEVFNQYMILRHGPAPEEYTF